MSPLRHNASDRWAVILAGGDGTRLQSMTRTITGDDRPKQFVPSLVAALCWIKLGLVGVVSFAKRVPCLSLPKSIDDFYRTTG